MHFERKRHGRLLCAAKRIRVEEAKRLLSIRLELGIKEVGAMVGYPDPYYFSRVFKEQTNQYSKEYRQNRNEE